jgi:hypothetical protein
MMQRFGLPNSAAFLPAPVMENPALKPFGVDYDV